MKLNSFSKVEELYYSIYRIQLIDGQNAGKPSKLVLYFRDKLDCIELRTDKLDTPKVFCELYSELYHTPAPSFNRKSWEAFLKMLFERAQLVG
jgi:hypothetical protein